MGMNRAEKAGEIEDWKSRFENNESVVVFHYSGSTVSEMTQVRAAGHAEGVSVKVPKNTLARQGLKGTKVEGLADLFKGPTAVASGKDPIAAMRIVHTASKANPKLVILGGAMSGEVLNAEKVKYLATLPSLDQLRGKLVGLLQAPGAQIARVVNAYATKDGAGA